MMRVSRSCSVAALAAAMALLAAGSGHAQVPGVANGRSLPPVTKNRQAPEQPNLPPPALPGAQNSFAPAERTATDLSPTDALFDAINRGDMASARDAINRGADLAGHNILGMTPVDLSVDLGRNNITFLLLSLRGGSTPTARPAPAATKGAAAPARPASKLATLPPRPAPLAQPVVARQFAGPANPGTPVPQAGFLGFGGAVQ